MSATIHHVRVHHPSELDRVAMSYIAQGYVVSTRDAMSLTLYKRKEFNVLYAIVGFFLCVLPLFIYCIVYAMQRDQMVVVQAAGTAPIGPAGPQGPDGVHLSPDGRYWWDGFAWQPLPGPGEQRPPA